MKTLGIAAGALVCAGTTSAFAQSPPSEAARDTINTPVRAPRNALELGVEAGYTQGFGSATSDPRVGAGPGGTFGVSLDDRIHPSWSFGMRGQFQGYSASGRRADAASLRGVTADIHTTYHVSPYNRLDPTVSLGAGYRLLVESPVSDAPTRLMHGLQIGKLELGLDLRPSESVAISPMVGVDVNLFLSRAGRMGAASFDNATVNTFVFAGVKGRFDLGGSRDVKPLPQ